MKNSSETIKMEHGKERIPTREEIWEQIKKHSPKAEFVNEVEDKDGIFLIEARAWGKKQGEYTDYLYKRKEVVPGSGPLRAVLEEEYFVNGAMVGRKIIDKYDSAAGQWASVAGEWIEERSE